MKLTSLPPEETIFWFDLDDTLWDFTYNSHEALADVYDFFNLQRFWSNKDEWRNDYHNVNNRLWQELAEGKIEMEHLRWQRFYETFINRGIPETESEKIAELADKYYLEKLGEREKTVPGAHNILEKLKKRGYRVGVISNGFIDVQYKKIRSAGLEKMIDYVVLSENVGVSKPNVTIFRYAQKIADVDAKNCIMIGDNENTDIYGAIKASWLYAIWLNPSNKNLLSSVLNIPQSNTKVLIINELSQISI